MARRSLGALIISLIYFVFGFLWIFFSDRILLNLVHDESYYVTIQTWKGWIYVLLTTILIYLLLRTYISGKNRAIRTLEEKETQLVGSLSEKEMLINELHHRVKNNLQMISSLINLNKTYNENDVRLLLDKIEDQLFALSALHERIYRDNEKLSIDIKDYIKGLAWGMERKSGISMNLSTGEDDEVVFIPVDIAVPVGIIINEGISEIRLRTDAPDEQTLINIDFKHKPDSYTIKISSPSKDRTSASERESLSLNLIRILSEQLRSELLLSEDNGQFLLSVTIPAI